MKNLWLFGELVCCVIWYYLTRPSLGQLLHMANVSNWDIEAPTEECPYWVVYCNTSHQSIGHGRTMHEALETAWYIQH